jgi:acyl dehydratase
MNESTPVLAVGDTLPPLVLRPIDRTTLALFCGASGDHNPMHVDIDYARKAGMPDVFAHGMLAMAYLGRMLTGWADQRRLRGFGVRFAGITHLGHRLSCQARVSEVFEVDGEQRVRLDIEAVNQYGEVKLAGDAVVAL